MVKHKRQGKNDKNQLNLSKQTKHSASKTLLVRFEASQTMERHKPCPVESPGKKTFCSHLRDYLDPCLSVSGWTSISVGSVYLLMFPSQVCSAKWRRHSAHKGEEGTVTLGTTQSDKLVKSYSAGSEQRFQSRSIFLLKMAHCVATRC